MGKYNFRMDGELEERFLEYLKMTRFKQSSLIRECIKLGLIELTAKGALEKFRYDQTHGWEITKNPQDNFGAYQDLKGCYHIPFELFQEGAVIRDLVDLRDGKKCRKCGGNNDSIYHPVDGNIANQSLENIITLCPKCECEVKAFLPKMYAKKLFAIWFYLTNPQPRVFKKQVD